MRARGARAGASRCRRARADDTRRAGGRAFPDVPVHTLNACPASYDHQVDPINDVFYANATDDRVLNHLAFHTGWADTGGSMQYFSSERVCAEMAGELASGFVFQSRYHIRTRRTFGADAAWGITAHRAWRC